MVTTRTSTSHLLAHLRVSRDEFLRFVLLFSRLEYSLKKTGILEQNVDWPKPDWVAFARRLAPGFDHRATVQLQAAVDYLLRDPPRQQVRRNDGVGWADPVVPAGQTQLEQLIKVIKIVRNNLLHGGKYATGLVRDPSRNPVLLNHASIVLEECLHLAEEHAPQVYHAFHEPLD